MPDCTTSNFDWPNFITLMLTFLTVLATFWAVMEMKKQRIQSNMPDLVFDTEEETRFHLYRETYGNVQWWHWYESRIDDIEQIKISPHFLFEIACTNIGVGTAKRVKVNYEIDGQKIKVFLESFTETKVEDLTLSGENLNFGGSVQNYKIGLNILKSDLNPSKMFISSKRPVKIRLPKIYLALYNAFVMSTVYSGIGLTNADKFPPLKMNVSYQDIANKLYKKTFSVSIVLDSIGIVSGYPAQVGGKIMISEL